MNIFIKKLFSLRLSITTNGMPVPNRSRSFCFTLNNYTPAQEVLMQSLPGITYLTYGREVAPTTGTRHLQGYVRFAHGKTLTSVRTTLLGCHVEVAITTEAAINYAQKDGDFFEVGTRPQSDQTRGQNEVARWEASWIAAKSGEIENIPPDIRLRNYPTIRRIERDYMVSPTPLPQVCGIWLFGLSGVGKTHSVYARYPDLYSKNASKWWDGYQGEDVVLLDDVDPSQAVWITRFLKIWSDKYPFIAELKGGSRYLRPKTFIVTSQYTIEQLFLDLPTREALNRRFTFHQKVDRDHEITF